MNDTLQYYNEHAAEFVQDTQNSDMHEKYEPFLSRVVLGGHILDLGCGSGRDSAEFIKRGYQVTVLTGIPNYPEGKFYPGYSWFNRYC
jgi:SAM-dependent methyltransferase